MLYCQYRSEVYMELVKDLMVRDLYFKVKQYCEKRKYINSLEALPYAYSKHLGVTRIGGLPYIIHPLSVAWQGILLGINSDIEIAVALLHDVPEDCDTSLDDLRVDPIIKNICNNILNVHKFENEAWDKHERNRLYFDEISKSEIATMAKFGDTNHNLSTMIQDFPPEKILKNVIEKREFVYPLLEEAEQRYANDPLRVAQIAYFKQNILKLVEQADHFLGDQGTKLQRVPFIA